VRRRTPSARASLAPLGHWDVNDEAIYQFGQFGSGAVNAWSVAIDHGFTLKNLWSQPRLGLRAAIASGDSNPADADLQTSTRFSCAAITLVKWDF
jgi:hypothetical protein